MANDNMRLWSQVEKTDPAHTKRVNQRGGFTSIDAHYQVQRATELFGPVGQGWGYNVVYGLERLGDDLSVATADVTLWYIQDNEHCSYGPWRGATPLLTPSKGGPRLDDDAWKKATTDALTKALSHLGFSADVFLGKYDDNKYIARLEKEKAEAIGRVVNSYTDELRQAIVNGDEAVAMGLIRDVRENQGDDAWTALWQQLNMKERQKVREWSAPVKATA